MVPLIRDRLVPETIYNIILSLSVLMSDLSGNSSGGGGGGGGGGGRHKMLSDI